MLQIRYAATISWYGEGLNSATTVAARLILDIKVPAYGVTLVTTVRDSTALTAPGGGVLRRDAGAAAVTRHVPGGLRGGGGSRQGPQGSMGPTAARALLLATLALLASAGGTADPTASPGSTLHVSDSACNPA